MILPPQIWLTNFPLSVKLRQELTKGKPNFADSPPGDIHSDGTMTEEHHAWGLTP